MGTSLHNAEIRQKCSIIQSAGHLADAPAPVLHCALACECPRLQVTSFRRPQTHPVVERKNRTWFHKSPVKRIGSDFNISGPILVVQYKMLWKKQRLAR